MAAIRSVKKFENAAMQSVRSLRNFQTSPYDVIITAWIR